MSHVEIELSVALGVLLLSQLHYRFTFLLLILLI